MPTAPANSPTINSRIACKDPTIYLFLQGDFIPYISKLQILTLLPFHHFYERNFCVINHFELGPLSDLTNIHIMAQHLCLCHSAKQITAYRLNPPSGRFSKNGYKINIVEASLDYQLQCGVMHCTILRCSKEAVMN